jgi:hypothetical protein
VRYGEVRYGEVRYGEVCCATTSRNVGVSHFDVSVLFVRSLLNIIPTGRAGYPGRCLPSTSALPLSKDYRHIQNCFPNIILAPYTLLTSNEFQPLRHTSHAKANHIGPFFIASCRSRTASEGHSDTTGLRCLLRGRYVVKSAVG